MKSDFGMAVERPRRSGSGSFQSRWSKKLMIIYAKELVSIFEDLKATRFAGKRHLTKAQRKRLWNYGDDEIEIRSDATWERFKVSSIRSAAGDQFQRLRDEALRIQARHETR